MPLLSSRRLAVLVFLLWPLMAAAEKPFAPQSVPGTVLVTAEEAIELILSNPGVVIIDSRRQDEYDKGHIEGAISILDTAMTLDELELHIPTLSTPILVYCNGERCLRSSHAAEKLVTWGFSRVYWFRGGWAEWSAKQYPAVR